MTPWDREERTRQRRMIRREFAALLGDLPHNGRSTKHRYSLHRALTSIAKKKDGVFQPDGLEGEVSAEIARSAGKKPTGFYLPLDAPLEIRSDTLAARAGSGSDELAAQLFIDVLRSKLVVAALGGRITTLAAERGKVQLPVQTGATPTAWVAEGAAAPSVGALAVGSVTFTPNTILANTGVSRKLMDTFAPGFDTWLYGELGKDIALAIDLGAINGQGSVSNQPTGLMQLSGIPTYPRSS